MKATLTFIGHASLKFVTKNGTVIYVDPFFKDDYPEQANIVLITHNHSDHNNISLIEKADNCEIVTPEMAIVNGEHQKFNVHDVEIMSVQAYNQNHNINECVGYVIQFDGLKIYCAGDTSTTDDMKNKLPLLNLDYSLLPIDNIYNMGPQEASECAKMLNTKYAIAIHNSPSTSMEGIYSDKGVSEFDFSGKVIVKHGETIEL